MELGRVITAMVTPFNSDGELDAKRAGELAARLVDHGSDGILVAGTTGESPNLTRDERMRLLETVLQSVGHRAMVMAGSGTNSTAESIRLTRDAESGGAHAILLVTPYYNKPPQEGLYEHFAAIAAAAKLPVMLYNVPGRTSVNLAPSTVARLAKIANIVALKEAGGSLDQMTELRRATPAAFRIYSGDDSLTLPMMAVGACGVVSVASNVAGDAVQAMVSAAASGHWAEATQTHLAIYPLFKALFVTTSPIPVKLALALTGFPVGGVRGPLCPASDREHEVVRSALRNAGLIA